MLHHGTPRVPSFASLLPLVIGALTLATPVIAGASEPAEKPVLDDGAAHLTALELMVRPTLGGAGGSSLVHIPPGVPGNNSKIFDGSASPYGVTYGIGAELGFRFHPLVSAGLRGDLAKVSATAPDDGSKDLSRSRLSAGLYARVYPLALNEGIRKYLDPWFSTGIVYMRDTQDFHSPITNNGTTIDAQVNITHHGVGVPLAIGVDYRITRALSVGPSFEYTLLVPIAGCATRTAAGYQPNEACSGGSGAESKAITADSTGAWTAGLQLRFTPF